VVLFKVQPIVSLFLEVEISIFENTKNTCMDIQAEIKWIKTELSRVNDPSLIEIFVKLLKNRKLIESNNKGTAPLAIDTFSFLTSREKLKNYKGSLAEAVIEERRAEQ